MKNKKLLIVGLLGLVALSGCKGKSSSLPASSDGPSDPGPSVSVSQPDPAVFANGIRTFAGETKANIQARKDILTLLESYALDTFIGGIPYRDNSGIVLYSEDLEIPTDNYVTGYGFGVGEGTITAPLTGANVAPERNMYYHAWQSQDPGTINYLDSQESVTADLYSMISSSYWGTKFNADKTGYEWYPLLANDVERPIPLNFDETTGTATKWRVPVKVGGALKYDTLSAAHSEFKGRAVVLDDYLTPFKVMLEAGWFRATDLASASSGFVGVAAELNKPVGERSIDRVAGIKLNREKVALDFEFNSAKTPFYAMYNLSSSIFSPFPLEFVEKIGADKFGGANIDSVLSLGVYTLEIWEQGKQVVFKKNPTYIESDRYNHAGYVYTQIADGNTAFEEFLAGNLHGARIPASYLAQYRDDPRGRVTKGDVTWKLQVNALDQDRWNELFGPEGIIVPEGEWDVKPVMSNMDFLNGVYYALDREALAYATGSRPALSFFSEAYMIDPESGISWRESPEGKAVIADRSLETYGFNKEASAQLFNQAMNDLVAAGKYTRGTKANPTVISLRIHFQDQQQTVDEGGPLKSMIEEAFNDAVEGFKLEIELFATENWMDAYYAMMFGEFDFAFGTIGGNTLDPLSFMETICSDNRSGFTLSWGIDTSKAVPEGQLGALNFRDELYAFDALLESAMGFTVVRDGEAVSALDLTGLGFGRNKNDPSKYDAVFAGTYYVDPEGEYTVEPDPNGLASGTGNFIGLVFSQYMGSGKPAKFLGVVEVPCVKWEDGEWMASVQGFTVPDEAHADYIDIYINTIRTYKGHSEYHAMLFESYWLGYLQPKPVEPDPLLFR